MEVTKNWEQYTQSEMVKVLEALYQKHLAIPKDSSITNLIHSCGQHTERKLAYLAKAKWKDSDKTRTQLRTIILFRASMERYRELLPDSLWQLFDEVTDKMAAATGQKSGMADVEKLTANKNNVKLLEDLSSRKAEALSISDSIDYLVSINHKVHNDLSLNDATLRYYQARLVESYRHSEESSPVKPLIKRVVANIRHRRSNVSPTRLNNKASNLRSQPSFDIKENGICWNTSMLEAKVLSTNPRELNKEALLPSIRRSLPFFSRVSEGTKHSSYSKWTISTGIELFVYNKGQITFGQSPLHLVSKFTKRLLKRARPEKVFIWGDSEYCRVMAEHCSKLDIASRILTKAELTKIKERVEISINAEESQDTVQKKISVNKIAD